MIRLSKAYLRIACIVLWMPAVFVLRLLCMPIRLLSKRREAHLRRRVFKFFCKGVLLFLGLRVEVRGTPPDRPYLLASNHLAGVDIFVLGSVLGPIFVSQGEVAHWPFVGPIVRSVETIFIDRLRLKEVVRVIALLTEKLDAGEGIVLFPESTTAQDGQLLPFKSALFEAPVQAKLPVHYASLSYQTPPGEPAPLESIVWRDPDNALAHFVKVASLKSSTAIVVFGGDPILGSDRRALAESVREAIREGCLPLD